jgi:hypothetical protein
VILKVDLAAVAVVLVGVLWFEHGHRVVIEPPTSTELARREAAAAACPASDSMPYGTDCLAYLKGGAGSGLRRLNAAESKPAVLAYAPGRAELAATPCPDSDNVPYSKSCVTFLSGWLWRVNAAEDPAAGRNTP